MRTLPAWLSMIVGVSAFAQCEPVVVGSAPLTSTSAMFGLTSGVVINSDRAYVADGDVFRVFDVADPAHLTPLGSIDTGRPISDVALAGDVAYLAQLGAVISVDVSNPTMPMILGEFDGVTSPPREYYALDVEGDLLVVGQNTTVSIDVLDVSDPANPTKIGDSSGGIVFDLRIMGSTIVTAGLTGNSFISLNIHDITDPSAPFRTGSLFYTPFNFALELEGSLALVGVFGDLLIADLSNPSFPAFVSATQIADANPDPDVTSLINTLHTADGIAYASVSDGRLVVVDVTDPVAPEVITAVQLGSRIRGMDLVGDLLYVSAADSGGGPGSLLIVDISACGPLPDPCSAADLAAPFGAIDISDVIAFLIAFSEANAAADLAPPFGTFDFSDVLAFLTAVAAGCP